MSQKSTAESSRFQYDRSFTPNNSKYSVDMYVRFERNFKSSALSDSKLDSVLKLYSDVYIHVSPELADRLLEIIPSFSQLEFVHQRVLSSIWSKELIEYLTKLSPEALYFAMEFKINTQQDDRLWMLKVLKIVSGFTNSQIAEALEIRKSFLIKNYNRRYNLFMSHATTRDSPLSELPLVAALMLVQYDANTLSIADDLLNREFEVDDLSIDKLMSVSQFLKDGGSCDTPVQWMIEAAAI